MIYVKLGTQFFKELDCSSHTVRSYLSNVNTDSPALFLPLENGLLIARLFVVTLPALLEALLVHGSVIKPAPALLCAVARKLVTHSTGRIRYFCRRLSRCSPNAEAFSPALVVTVRTFLSITAPYTSFLAPIAHSRIAVLGVADTCTVFFSGCGNCADEEGSEQEYLHR